MVASTKSTMITLFSYPTARKRFVPDKPPPSGFRAALPHLRSPEARIMLPTCKKENLKATIIGPHSAERCERFRRHGLQVKCEQIQEVLKLYNAGLYLRAYQEGCNIAPLHQWRGIAGRIMAGRLAGNLGGGHLGKVLHYLAYREHPGEPEAWYYYAFVILGQRGPLEAWQFLRDHTMPDGASLELQSNWYGMKARILGIMRDFKAAHQMLEAGEEIHRDDPWLAVERCDVLERQDRYDEALSAIMRGLEIRPWYRPAVQSAAHLMQLLNKEEQSLELLQQATLQNQSMALVLQLAALQTEMRCYQDARLNYSRAIELAPLMDRKLRDWLFGMQSDAAYFCTDYSAAADLAEKSKNPFYRKVAAKLKSADQNSRRVVLPVGFVRQHHLTCGPAVVACLGRFWQKPVDHQRLAIEICYDGTANHALRQWAVEHGWLVREFRVTWETTRALIDLGVPFALSTVEPTGAHLQAVIGYDDLRGTLIIRDPYVRPVVEFVSDMTLERYASTGPLGIVLIPEEKKQLLDEVVLCEEALYDQLHGVNAALHRHDRNSACAACANLQATAPGHRLTLTAEQVIAAYDADPVTLLNCYDKLLAQYPTDCGMLIGKLQCLKTLARRDQRIDMLEKVGAVRASHPIFRELYAKELMHDAREHATVRRILRRVIHAMPLAANAYSDLASVFWDQRRFKESLEIYRFTCCLDDKNENFARSYFVASRHFKQEAEVLEMLTQRFKQFGTHSGRPAEMLFWALDALDRSSEAFSLLDQAIGLRPEDGSLLLLAASSNARCGRLGQADTHMARAKGLCSEREWLRVAADIVLYKGDPREALGLWQKIVDGEPLAMDALRRVTELLAQGSGNQAAEAYLDAHCARFPHHYPLLQLRVMWFRDQLPHRYEAAVRQLMQLHPHDAWSRREMVAALLNLQQWNQAAAEADTALVLEPNHPASQYYCGLVALRRGDARQAAAAFKRAINLSVDYTPAIHELLAGENSPAGRKEALAFVHAEIVRQTIFGECLTAYREQAAKILDADEVLASLQAALQARPDLWQAWSGVTLQLTQMGKLEDAHRNGCAAVEKFGLLPALWLDLAGVYRAMADTDRERAALRQALEINRCWSIPARQLAALHIRCGDLVNARTALEEIISRSPFDVRNHGMLADVLWRMGARQKAMQHLQHALEREPAYSWGWDALKSWSRELNEPDAPLTLARQLTVTRCGDSRMWLNLAHMLYLPAQQEERLTAYNQAIAADPRCIEAYDERAAALAEAGRTEEALAACNPEVFNGDVPFELRGRVAWIQYRRGNRSQAIGDMAALIKESPRYFWGVCCLAEWYQTAGDKNQYLRTAETLVRTWPVSAVAHGFLGDALRGKGTLSEARKSFQRAVELDAAYTYAIENLFEMDLAAGKLSDAAKWEKQLDQHAAPGRSSLARLEIAAARNERNMAMVELTALCRIPAAQRWMLERALEILAGKKWSKSIGYYVREAMSRNDCNVLIGEMCVGCLAQHQHWKRCREFVNSLDAHTENFRRAMLELIQQLAVRNKFLTISALIRRYRRQLQENTELWGKIGYALKRSGRDRKVIAWMKDWRQRPDVKAWMLGNLATAYRAVGSRAEGIEVNKFAVKIDGEPADRTIHALWLAADAALLKQPDSAEAWLSQAGVTPNSPPHHRFIQTLIEAVLRRLREPDTPFSATRSQITAAVRLYPAFRKTREIKVLYRQSLYRISRSKSGLSGMLWCWNQMVQAL